MLKSLNRLFGFSGGSDPSVSLEFSDREEQNRLEALSEMGKAKREEHFGVMALSYAMATKRWSDAEYLLRERKIKTKGCFGLIDRPLFALIDFNEDSPNDQTIGAQLLKKYGEIFVVWDLDKHSSDISKKMWSFMFPGGSSDNVDIYIPPEVDHLKSYPFAALSLHRMENRINILALSYACLIEMPVEAEFLVRMLGTPAQGANDLLGEPLRAAKWSASDRMLDILASHGVAQINSDTRKPRVI